MEKRPIPETRKGKKPVTAWLEPPIARKLKMFAAERDVTQDSLLVDCVVTFLQQHGKLTDQRSA